MTKQSKRGVTLVELICVLALVSILSLFLGRVLLSASQQHTDIVNADRAKVSLNQMQETLAGKLRYAGGTLAVAKDKPDSGSYYFCDGKRLYYHDGATGADTDLLGDDFYSAPGYRITFLVQESNAVGLRMWAGKGDILASNPVGTQTYHLANYTVRVLVGTVQGTAGAEGQYLIHLPA